MRQLDGIVVPRHHVFTLRDATFVVQWQEGRVQELLSGLHRPFNRVKDYAHAITDYELAQLRISGRVEHYNANYIWLANLPEGGRFGLRRMLGGEEREMSYYVVTPYSRSQLAHVKSRLQELKQTYSVKTQNGMVVIFQHSEVPFPTLEEAEGAQNHLYRIAPNFFHHMAIGFIDKNTQAAVQKTSSMNSKNTSSASSQQDITGKLVILALRLEDEQNALGQMLASMQLNVKYAASAFEALELLEDNNADLLVMDIQLPDMHGWKLLNKINEIEQLRHVPIMVIADQPDFTKTVARVEYLTRPISIARLRQTISTRLKQNQ